ncbi:MAG: dCTP deaminase [Ignisphaera sp.]|uniref:dCTP deaminase n=1 Tax=Ignisphaera aggregans TaxID=334771 RepID=A0A7J3MXF7_9CREN
MILSDFDLKNYIRSGRVAVEPFDEDIVRENGLDLRIGDEVCELIEVDEVLDPYVASEADLSRFYKCWRADTFIVKPYGRYLLTTLEYIKVPPELMAFVELRSTFARMGLSIPPTIIDGGFEGQITIELHGSSFPVKLRYGTRFIHVVFSRVTSPIEKPYSGGYQKQKGVKPPRLPLTP